MDSEPSKTRGAAVWVPRDTFPGRLTLKHPRRRSHQHCANGVRHNRTEQITFHHLLFHLILIFAICSHLAIRRNTHRRGLFTGTQPNERLMSRLRCGKGLSGLYRGRAEH